MSCFGNGFAYNMTICCTNIAISLYIENRKLLSFLGVHHRSTTPLL